MSAFRLRAVVGVVAACLALLPPSTLAQFTCRVEHVGCFEDYIGGARILLVQVPDPPNLTQELCAARCKVIGFDLSGVEYHTQCFCASEFSATVPIHPKPDSDCEALKCPGNSTQGCGGPGRILVSTAECAGTPIPNYHGCLSDTAKAQPYCNASKSVDDRVDALLAALDADELMALISPDPALGNTCEAHTAGVDRLDISPWMWLVETNTNVASMCLGPDRCATTFPGPLSMAASFNRTSWQAKGMVMGTEMRAMNNVGWHRATLTGNIGLTGYGPNINIARDPRFGRTSELAGEDPFLAGTYAAHMLQGMQHEDSNGHPLMLSYLKHFTAYSTETNRGHDSYNISAFDFWDTYLRQYAIAFQEGNAQGVMCSYNAENGAPSCANDYILNQVMRGLWNADAIVTTDCGAVSNLLGPPVNAADAPHAVAMALNNGTDVEMGSTLFKEALATALNSSLVSTDTLKAAARRAVLPFFKLGRFDPLQDVEWTSIPYTAVNSSTSQQVQMEAALQGMVLLKNTLHALPLRKGGKIAVVGPQAVSRDGLVSDYAADQLCFQPDNGCIPTIAEAIAEVNGGNVVWSKGVDINSTDTSHQQEALDMCSQASACVVVLGIDKSIEREGVDRTDTALPGLQESFARAAFLTTHRPLILVLVNGGQLAIDSLVNTPDAIVEVFNPNVAGSRALAQTLFGESNRWGKLPYTLYPHSFISEQDMTNYDMAKAPGRTYRYYTGQPLFPFGFGLSYTEFGLACEAGSQKLAYACTVTNAGVFDGDEVVMVFHRAPAGLSSKVSHPVPTQTLVEFGRVSVAAGGSDVLQFQLTDDALSLVNEKGDRVLYDGTHTLAFSRGHGDEVAFEVAVKSRNVRGALVP